MSLPVVTRPAAAAEIETAYRWYEKEREGLGSEFLEAVEKMVQEIAENSERFAVIRKGPGTIERHGGYEDVYVKTEEGWRIKSRTHVRNKAWHAEALRTPDLN